MRATPSTPIATLLCLVLMAGCTEQREAEVLPEPASPVCEGVAPRTLDEVFATHFSAQQPTGCITACHEQGLGGLTFRDAQEMWQATVNRTSTGQPMRRLVVPGRPEYSHFYLKLLPDSPGRMPQGGPYLDEAALRDVAGWICSGAPAPSGGGTTDGGTDNPRPQLDSLTPSSVLVGTGEVGVTLGGGGFLSSSQVSFDGVPLTPTYVSPSQLEVLLPAAITAESGTHRFRVSNPPPGGGDSSEQEFLVTNPAPALSNLNPSSVATNGAPFTLTLTGTGFTAASTVVFNGSDVTTTYGGPTTLTGRIPTLATPGGYAITVRNPAPGGGTSNGLTLTAIDSSAPSITGLAPARVVASAAFSLTVTGSGYVCSPPASRSTVLFNGSSYTPSSCASTQLTVSLPATPAGDYPVQVRNSNGETSNTLMLEVREANPVPTLTALSPSQGERGGVAFTLRATGTGFVPGATLSFNGNSRSTTYVSPTEVTAAIPASDLGTTGSFPVTVANPAPGGGASNSLDFSVVAPNPLPSVSSLSPCGTVAGTAGFTLTLSGTGFVAGASATFNGSPVTVTFVSTGELRASIPASLVASAPSGNAAAVVITNPAPGGGSSAPAYFGVATQSVTLANDVQPIFTASCANAGCHSSPSTPVNLTAGRSYGELVGVPSSGCSSRLQVMACGPLRNQSFLIDKILATNNSPACSGAPMPKGTPLTAAQKQLIIDWVAQGAPQ
ncbi:IPT/TIG domain-containing protein [Archangium lansingense]|uniref:IPT/TIG domain-containing protein n=1 Tax=Archangium lansingense TaxID=2995310 RepID=A0ABT4AEM8_9BACT|nr:IPT/TIG domain-containing protein [Archangium lansinium]MCY1080129.1 IPT/TIG domain-containing protein [Archangium lansinium]